MAYASLQSFLESLEQAGELHRVTEPVSCMLEAAAIADRVSKSPAARLSDHAPATDPVHHSLGGKALLFENITLPDGLRSDVPLLINAFGSYRRIEMALGCEDVGLEGLAQRVADLVKPEPPNTLMEKLKKGLELAKIAQLPPKVVSRGACQEVVQTGAEIDLTKLPIIKCWPDDGDPRSCGYPLSPEQSGTAGGLGRYITLAGMYTIHPDDAGKPEGEPRPSRNIGMYRAQLIDETHTAMHWHIHHDGARHWRAWKKRNEAMGDHSTGMPCAIVFGGESVLPYGATAPLPPGISELLFAGFLNKGSIKLVRCKSIDMHVPANAEIVIEGFVSTQAGGIGYDPRDKEAAPLDPEHEVFEGPFGDHTGFYSLPDRYPIFTATAVTMREKPVYPTTIVGPPPQEDYYLGKATERIFLPLLKTLVPDILDYDLPMFGAFHNCAFIQIKKEYPLQARRVMHAIWGAGQMAWTKFIVVVDDDVDVHNHAEVLFHLCANVDPGRDLEIVHGPLDILDHAAPRLGGGQKLGVDATRKWPGEEVNGNAVRDWPTYLGKHRGMPESVDAIVKQITSTGP
ncbi:MAG: UbiD family decarboxylase domain-containing protein [Planctomycetota bacterium]